jgi:putative membrane protein
MLAEGETPDPRFTFANERTFLAWIRTALALMAGGLGVEAFAEDIPDWSRTVLASVLVALGGALAFASFQRWQRAEVALRRNEELPPTRRPQIIAFGLAAVAAAVLVLILLSDPAAR